MRYVSVLSIVLMSLALLAPGAEARQLEIGTTAAVNPATTGTPPGQETRTLFIGANVFFKERIATSETGQTQLLFLDASSLTVGPNSEVVLDEFVYDPGTSTGALALTISKGVFRFIGGQISKTAGVTIRTPHATLGIRGSIIQGSISSVQTEATFVAGNLMTVETCPTPGSCTTQTITRPEYTANVALGSISVTKASGDQLAAQGTELEGSTDQSGGTDETPTDDQVAGTGIDQTGSTGDPTTIVVVTATDTTTGTDGTTTLDPGTADDLGEQTTASQDQATESGVSFPGVYSGTVLDTPDPYTTSFGSFIADPLAQAVLGGPDPEFHEGFTDGAINNGKITFTLDGDPVELPIQIGEFSFSGVTVPDDPVDTTISGTGFLDPSGAFAFYEVINDSDGTPSFGFGGIPTPDSVFAAASTFRVDSYELRPDFILGSAIPFLRDEIASNFPDATVSDFLLARPPSGSIGDTDVPFKTKTLWAALSIEGQGAGQTSLLIGTAGSLFELPSGKVAIAQGTRGSARLDASDEAIRFTSAIGSVPGGADNHFFGADLDFFVLDPNFLFEDDVGAETAFFDAAFEQPLDLITSTSFEYGFRHVAMKIETPAGIGDVRTDNALNGYAAGIAATRLKGDVFPDPYLLANDDPLDVSVTTETATSSVTAIFDLEDVLDDSDVDSLKFTFGGSGAGRGAFIDDDLFGARNSSIITGGVRLDATPGTLEPGLPSIEAEGQIFNPFGFRSFMVTQGLVPDDSFLPAGVTFCTCEYLSWGYWLSDFRFDFDTGDPGPDPNSFRRERVHLATWVAGDLPELAEIIPIGGTATYSGHAIGNVFSSGDQYVAIGNFENEWDFDSRTGTITITDFDGRDFAGAAAATLVNRRDYSGVIDPTAGISGTVTGSFFAGGIDPVAETGGQFTLTNGTTYQAAGTFAATK